MSSGKLVPSEETLVPCVHPQPIQLSKWREAQIDMMGRQEDSSLIWIACLCGQLIFYRQALLIRIEPTHLPWLVSLSTTCFFLRTHPPVSSAFRDPPRIPYLLFFQLGRIVSSACMRDDVGDTINFNNPAVRCPKLLDPTCSSGKHSVSGRGSVPASSKRTTTKHEGRADETGRDQKRAHTRERASPAPARARRLTRPSRLGPKPPKTKAGD